MIYINCNKYVHWYLTVDLYLNIYFRKCLLFLASHSFECDMYVITAKRRKRFRIAWASVGRFLFSENNRRFVSPVKKRDDFDLQTPNQDFRNPHQDDIIPIIWYIYRNIYTIIINEMNVKIPYMHAMGYSKPGCLGNNLFVRDQVLKLVAILFPPYSWLPCLSCLSNDEWLLRMRQPGSWL